jgi:cytochrome c553
MANSDQRSALPIRGESATHAAGLRRNVHALAAAAIAAVVAATVGGAAAQEPAAGRQKALHCQACHGLDGLAKIPGAPHLAGQVREYLVTAMRDYKTGARKNEVMAVAMRQLTDEDIEELAAYYAGLDPGAKVER